jgi:acyl-ACP thioesterase
MEFVEIPNIGRRFQQQFTIGLSDADPSGRMRLDAVARVLHDIATFDNQDAPIADKGLWVIRSLELEISRFPRYLEQITAVTACTGYGRAWAERRTDLIAANVDIRARATWVNTSPLSGLPASLPEGFIEVYGESACGRRIKPRLDLARPRGGKPIATREFEVRYCDLDIVGHVNNAVHFVLLEELMARSLPDPAFKDLVGVRIEFIRSLPAPGIAQLALFQPATVEISSDGTLCSVAELVF